MKGHQWKGNVHTLQLKHFNTPCAYKLTKLAAPVVQKFPFAESKCISIRQGFHVEKGYLNLKIQNKSPYLHADLVDSKMR